MSKRLSIILTICFLLFFFYTPPIWAQEEPSNDEGSNEESEVSSFIDEEKINFQEFLNDSSIPFTGTLAEDDEDNAAALEEEKLFGTEEEPLDVPEAQEDALGTHLLKFEFISRVQFVNREGIDPNIEYIGEPYMEIQYTTRFETPIKLTDKRNSLDLDAEYDVDNWGSLASNEFFDCRLDIALHAMPVSIVTRMHKEIEEEQEFEKLALKITFSRELKEDWFSLCTDVSGANLNTQGDSEVYNFKVLKLIEPSLSGLLIEDFQKDKDFTINLSVTQQTFEDIEISNNILFSGEGKISIEPI